MSTIFDDLQREFHACVKQKAEIVEKLKPLRDKVDACEAVKQEAEAQLKVAATHWRKAMEDLELFELDNHIARIARALDGKTGKPPKGL